MRSVGVGVKVGGGPTAAGYRVEDIEAVACLLEDLASMVAGPDTSRRDDAPS